MLARWLIYRPMGTSIQTQRDDLAANRQEPMPANAFQHITGGVNFPRFISDKWRYGALSRAA